MKGMAFFKNEKLVGSLLIIFEYFLINTFADFLRITVRIKATRIVPTTRTKY
jgi:hypothetical protein